ncbi:MAG: hypothetical protein V2I26_11585 [Halieaceae bacterium]|jgi:uncharacterized protein YdeI (BOF family)|nr:hypothetical protein [Halieaceae bacterium]
MNRTQLTGLAAVFALNVGTALAVDPYSKPDDSWISIGGTVVEAKDDSFMLDYGENLITVEVDDWDSYPEASALMDGDRVTVYGKVDDDMFEKASIEAGSIFVHGLNTYIYASSVDEEGDTSSFYPYYWNTTAIPFDNQVTVRGTVTSVNPQEREFKVNRGTRELTVETGSMYYNPLDKLGFQRIEKGDIVSVTGKIDHDFFGRRHLEADQVTTILDASKSS